MRKFSLVLLVLIGIIGAHSAYAQTPSTTIRDAVQQQVQQELSAIKQDVAKKGFVGNITAKSDGTVTISNLKNQTRNILVTGETTIKLSGGGEGTPGDLKVNDFIIAMGSVDSTNKMTAARLLVTKQGEADKREAKYGVVTKTTTSSITVGELVIKVTSATGYTTVTEGKIAKSKLADIKVGSKIVYVGTPGTTNAFAATDIHLIP